MANAKRRRRAVSKVRLTKENRSRFIKPKVANPVVREKWNPDASVEANLVKVGVSADPNKAVASTIRKQQQPAAELPVEKIFGLPPPEVMNRNPRRRIMSEEDQRYIAKLLARHGENYKAMERDMETNCWQHTARKLSKMADTFLRALAPDQRLVAVPRNVRAGGGE